MRLAPVINRWLCLLTAVLAIVEVIESRRSDRHRSHEIDTYDDQEDLSLWIGEQQLKLLSGFSMRVYAIINGRVNADLRDPTFNNKLPTIPSDVNYVNFTWKSGSKRYRYNFDRLSSSDLEILAAPTVSIKTEGKIPRHEKDFSMFLPCTGDKPGTAQFQIGLSIQNRKAIPLPGTPLRLKFYKECAHRGVYDDRTASTTLTPSQGPDPDCVTNCGNNGYCTHDGVCVCKVGFMAPYCRRALCYPQCMNGGNCTAPAVCSCPLGYHGSYCEGGICSQKCENGGKCIGKDKCRCRKGFYGLHCEFSKCVIPCSNKGKCIGSNICKCPPGTSGNHCEIGRVLTQRSTDCKRKCPKNSIPDEKDKCKCHCKDGFYGKRCNARHKDVNKARKTRPNKKGSRKQSPKSTKAVRKNIY